MRGVSCGKFEIAQLSTASGWVRGSPRVSAKCAATFTAAITLPDKLNFPTARTSGESVMVFAKTNGNESRGDRAVASAQEEIRRLSRDSNAPGQEGSAMRAEEAAAF